MRATYGATAASATARTDYDPFGTPLMGPGLVAPTDYGYAGEPQPGATGLVQLRARWYSPAQGQFTARDPFGGDPATPQGYNPYGYADADPINHTDPTGLFVAADPLGSGGGAGGTVATGASALGAVLAALGRLTTGNRDAACSVSASGLLLLSAPPDLVEETITVIVHTVPIVVAGATVEAAAAASCLVACPIAIAVGGTVLIVLVVASAMTPYPAYDGSAPQPGPAPCPLNPLGVPDCGRATGTTTKSEGKFYLYHYTFPEFLPSILATGLRPSINDPNDPNSDAQHGDGQYLTDLSPEDASRLNVPTFKSLVCEPVPLGGYKT